MGKSGDTLSGLGGVDNGFGIGFVGGSLGTSGNVFFGGGILILK